MKRKILTQLMIGMNISTRRLSEHLGDTPWRSKIIWNEELPCPTKSSAYVALCCSLYKSKPTLWGKVCKMFNILLV